MKQGLHSLKGLAWQLGIPLRRLLALADAVDRHYHPFEARRPGKKPRLIDNPSDELKSVQKAIRKNVLVGQPVHEAVRACVKGGSPQRHAAAVANRRGIAETDIKNCFPKITNARVFRMFRSLGWGPRTASLLTKLVTRCGHLPQGAPTSDLVANLALRELDEVVSAIAAERHLVYSRCMDGFVVAGSGNTREALGLIIDAVISEGLPVRRRKTKNAGAGRAHQVAGYNVNGPHGPRVCRSKRQEIRTAVYRFVLAHRRGEDIEARIPTIRGYFAYLGQTNSGLVRRLVRQIQAAGIPWRDVDPSVQVGQAMETAAAC